MDENKVKYSVDCSISPNNHFSFIPNNDGLENTTIIFDDYDAINHFNLVIKQYGIGSGLLSGDAFEAYLTLNFKFNNIGVQRCYGFHIPIDEVKELIQEIYNQTLK